MQEYKPYLMWDDSTKDGQAETIMDYVLSWCLRCACYRYVKDEQPILYQYCKYMICKLIEKEDDIEKISIDDVQVWKQEKYIDLWVSVNLHINQEKETHAILIEDKYYTGAKDGQLQGYKTIFDEYYKGNNDIPETHRHYALITRQYGDTEAFITLQEQCQKTDKRFQCLNIYDLIDKSMNFNLSESDIFNEFFIRDWL